MSEPMNEGMRAGISGRRAVRGAALALFASATALFAVGCGGTGPAGGGGYDEAAGTVTLPEPGSPFIAFNIWVKAGSQNDPEGKEGLASLTASMVSDGATLQDSYQSILEKLYPMATGYSASVDKEMTVFRGRVHRDNLEAFYDLFRAALMEPAFAEEDFERIKSQALNFAERGRRFGRDEELSKELLMWMAFQGTPYEHPEEGYVRSIQDITLDDVREFYGTFYTRDNVVVGLAGGYPDGFVSRVRTDFDALPEGAPDPVPAPEMRMPDGVKILIVEKPANAAAISFGFPIPVLRGQDGFWELMLANSWFGEHRNSFSNLYQVIREIRGMNYGDYSYIEAYPQGFATQVPPTNVARRQQLFEVWIRPISETDPGSLHDRTLFATRAAWRELDHLAEDGLPAEAVDATRNFLRNYTVNWGSTGTRRLAYAVDDAFYGIGAPGYLAGIRPGLEGVTAESVNEVIRANLQSENLWLVIVTRDAEELKELILSGAPTPIGYAAEQPDDVMAEDEEIAAFPIPVEAEDITILPIGEVFEGG